MRVILSGNKAFAFLLFIFLFSAACPSYAETVFADEAKIKQFITRMVVKHQFQEAELIRLFKQVKIKPLVIQFSKHPAENKTWKNYKRLFITPDHVLQGVRFWKKYQSVLAEAEKKYAVPASLIVATIGIESNYGKIMGDFRVIDALSTHAFNKNPRSAYFLRELEEFLLLAREQHLDPLSIKGSYAGAIGQPQFMPSSYRQYAVSSVKGAVIDLSHHEEDVIYSIANYYRKNGWLPNQPVAMPMSMAKGKYTFSAKKFKPITIADLIETGILADNLIGSDTHYKILSLQESHGSEYWISFNNFDVIKHYNNNEMYAMAIYQLSYYIAAKKRAPAPLYSLLVLPIKQWISTIKTLL